MCVRKKTKPNNVLLGNVYHKSCNTLKIKRGSLWVTSDNVTTCDCVRHMVPETFTKRAMLPNDQLKMWTLKRRRMSTIHVRLQWNSDIKTNGSEICNTCYDFDGFGGFRNAIKNNCKITPGAIKHGSWTFLGVILATASQWARGPMGASGGRMRRNITAPMLDLFFEL